jgi:integrase
MKQTRLTRRKDANYLSAYRRHADGCTETNDLNCSCPLWVQGRLAGKYVRESLNTRSYPMAQQQIKDKLNPPGPGGPGGGPRPVEITSGAVTLEAAEAAFLKYKADKSASTIKEYSYTVKHFRRFAEAHGVTDVRAVAPPLIQQYFLEYGNAWGQRTKITRATYLRIWCKFWCEMDWITVSPADKKLFSFARPTVHAREPFSIDEIKKIMEAVELVPESLHQGRGDWRGETMPHNRDRTRALVLLLLYSGMRISDAAFLERASISRAGILDYVVIKTRRQIGLPIQLHADAIAALAKLPGTGDFFFLPPGEYRAALDARHKGQRFEAKLPAGFMRQSVATTAALIERVLELAGLPGRCHRFRDTFAVNMLVGGADIYTVSQALGHADVKITSRHYLNLIPGYRERMSQSTRVLNYQLPKAG